MLWQYLQSTEWAKINQHVLSFANVFFSSQSCKRKQKFGTCVEPRKRFRVCCVAEAQAHRLELRNIKPQFALAGSVAQLLICVRCFCTEQ